MANKTLIVILGALLAGCAYTTPHFTGSSFDPSSMEVIGPASGVAEHSFFLGFGPEVGDANGYATEAVRQALKAVKGDVLINIVADETTSVYLFGAWVTKRVVVTGTAVRYKQK